MSRDTGGDEGSAEQPATGVVSTDSNVPFLPDADLRLYCARCAKGMEPEHVHSQLQLSLLFEPGICDYSWRDAAGSCHEAHIVGPQFLLIAPTVPHACHWQKEADLIIVYIESRLRELLLPTGSASFVTSDGVAGATQDLVVWQLAATLREVILERNAGDAQLVHDVAASVARRALKVLSGALPLGAPGAPKLSDERRRAVDEHILANLARDIHVADLARKAGLSLQHFTALFTATTGLSPYKYITRRRMLKAYEMLQPGQYRIAEVATAVGFPDQGYFTFRFKQYFNFSPRSVLLQTRTEPVKSPN